MNRLRLCIIVLIPCAFFLARPVWSEPFLLIQDTWGGVVSVPLLPDGSAGDPVIVCPMLGNAISGIIDLEVTAQGGYQLFGNGMVLPLGRAKLSNSSLENANTKAVSFSILPNDLGGWIASKRFIKTIGAPQQLVFPSFDNVITDMEYDAGSNRLAVLFNDGSVALCSAGPVEWWRALKLPLDQAVDLERRGSGFTVLTEKGVIYALTSETAQETAKIPGLANAKAKDLEMVQNSDWYYALDSDGKIHNGGGAPEVFVNTASVDSEFIVDLEIMTADEVPNWYPAGWNTSVALEPQEIRIDPKGPAKPVSLVVRNAENLSEFSAEIHFDPEKIRIEPHEVRLGAWWEKNMRGATAGAHIDPNRKGVISLKSGGRFLMYNGATGGGELLRIAVSALPSVTHGTSTLQVSSFIFGDASPLYYPKPARIEGAAEVLIRPSTPQVTLAWSKDGNPLDSAETTCKPGDILRADVLVNEGGRICDVRFDLRFTAGHLRFLGMTHGENWFPDAKVKTEFSTPSEAGPGGTLTGQRIYSSEPGAVKDAYGALVTLFFTVTQKGAGTLSLDQITLTDCNGTQLPAELMQDEIHFRGE